MGIFARLAMLIKSNLNDLISKSEDPVKMLNQAVLDMTTQLIEAKKQVAVSIADEKRLAKQAEQEASNAAEWERRAMLAVKSGDDNLARDALNRKKEHDSIAATYKDQWTKQKQAVDQLKTALRLLNNKIEEAKRKKAVLEARMTRATATEQINATLYNLNNASAFDTFERMEKKVDEAEARASAQAELSEEYSGDTLAQKFQKLEQNSGADDELLALKQKMGLAPAPEKPKPEPQQVRAPAAEKTAQAAPAGAPPSATQHDQDELAAALAELEAEEQRDQARMKR